MNFCLKTDSGDIIPLRELNSISGDGIVLVHLTIHIRKADAEKMEEYLSKKIGRKVIVLDACYSDVEILKVGD